MNGCTRIQEKLVAGEGLSGGEKDHLAACPECRQLAETHAWLLSEAAVCRECALPAEAPLAGTKATAPSRSRLVRVLAFSITAALVLALFWRPAADVTRVAEGLGMLLEEVDRATDVSYEAGEDAFPASEWLSSNGDDPTGGQYGWL